MLRLQRLMEGTKQRHRLQRRTKTVGRDKGRAWHRVWIAGWIEEEIALGRMLKRENATWETEEWRPWVKNEKGVEWMAEGGKNQEGKGGTAWVTQPQSKSAVIKDVCSDNGGRDAPVTYRSELVSPVLGNLADTSPESSPSSVHKLKGVRLRDIQHCLRFFTDK